VGTAAQAGPVARFLLQIGAAGGTPVGDEKKIENPWNELGPSEASGSGYGELNYTNEDGSDAKGE